MCALLLNQPPPPPALFSLCLPLYLSLLPPPRTGGTAALLSLPHPRPASFSPSLLIPFSPAPARSIDRSTQELPISPVLASIPPLPSLLPSASTSRARINPTGSCYLLRSSLRSSPATATPPRRRRRPLPAGQAGRPAGVTVPPIDTAHLREGRNKQTYACMLGGNEFHGSVVRRQLVQSNCLPRAGLLSIHSFIFRVAAIRWERRLKAHANFFLLFLFFRFGVCDCDHLVGEQE